LTGWRAVASAIAGAVLLGAVVAASAAAITHGTVDTEHPYVGLMTAHAAGGEYLWRCSGTLITPTVFVTAGHCTAPDDSQGFGPPTYAVVFFSNELIVPDPDFTLDTRSCDGIEGYPCGGANELAVRGTLYTHPQFDENAFFLHDLGVVVLDEPVSMPEYGALPELGALDSFHPGANTIFTQVGFGLQRSFPDAAARKNVQERIRLVAHPHLIQINGGYAGDYSLILSANASTGGQCFGDSGGPTFIDDSNVLAGVISFGKNPTCAGQGGVYRIDQADDLNWLATFLD